MIGTAVVEFKFNEGYEGLTGPLREALVDSRDTLEELGGGRLVWRRPPNADGSGVRRGNQLTDFKRVVARVAFPHLDSSGATARSLVGDAVTVLDSGYLYEAPIIGQRPVVRGSRAEPPEESPYEVGPLSWRDTNFVEFAAPGRARPGEWCGPVVSRPTELASEDQTVREVMRGDREVLGGRLERWAAAWTRDGQSSYLWIAYLGPRS